MRTHHEYREPPLPYQNKPALPLKYPDTLGLYAFGLAFLGSAGALAAVLVSPMASEFVEQDRLFLAVLTTFTTSATFSLFASEMKEILK
jgi:glutamate-1-semialdehyde aminotransferase